MPFPLFCSRMDTSKSEFKTRQNRVPMSTVNLSALKEQSLESINALNTPTDLEGLRVKLLGKNGEITGLLKTLGSLPPEERKSFGGEVNAVRSAVTEALAARKEKLDAIALEEKLFFSICLSSKIIIYDMDDFCESYLLCIFVPLKIF